MDNLAQTHFCINDVVVDLQQGLVTGRDNHSAVLQPIALEVLKLLAAHPGQIVSTEDLMQVMSSNNAGSEDSLMQCMIDIRQALGDANHQVVRAGMKRGYLLEANALDIDSNTVTHIPGTVHVRGSWLAGAAALALIVAAISFFWLIPQSEVKRPVTAASAVEKASSGSIGAQHKSAPNDPPKTPAPFTLTKEQFDTLSANLAVAQLEVERLQAENAGAREATARALADTKQVTNQNQQKVESLERELALAHQSIEDSKVNATIAATTLSTGAKERLTAEEALMLASKSLARERSRIVSLTNDLDKARQERDVLKTQSDMMSSTFRDDLAHERDRSAGLAHDLAEARAKLNTLTATVAKNKSILTVRTGKRGTQQPKASAASDTRPIGKSQGREVDAVDFAKPERPVRLDASSLPSALLPTRRPVQ